mmetsp:Transcript_1212/g.1434  ORF Transcript_1212/g.1434 Transcript_1212/m.1434 type:complete len:252 (-) Transcript_1212:221-976(-)
MSVGPMQPFNFQLVSGLNMPALVNHIPGGKRKRNSVPSVEELNLLHARLYAQMFPVLPIPFGSIHLLDSPTDFKDSQNLQSQLVAEKNNLEVLASVAGLQENSSKEENAPKKKRRTDDSLRKGANTAPVTVLVDAQPPSDDEDKPEEEPVDEKIKAVSPSTPKSAKKHTRVKWKDEDILQLWKAISESGSVWGTIRKSYFEGRTYDQVKDKGRRMLQNNNWLTGRNKDMKEESSEKAKAIARKILKELEVE